MRDPALPLLTPARPRRSCHRCPAPWRCLGAALPPVHAGTTSTVVPPLPCPVAMSWRRTPPFSRGHDLDGRATAALPRGDVLAPHSSVLTWARPRGSCRRRHAPWGCLG